MSLFTSNREKKLWIWIFFVCIAIFSSLFLGQPLAKIFSDQNVQAIIFVMVMLLVVATILVYGLKTKPNNSEWVIIIGLVAVYTMFFLRLGLPERSHLMEYSVLAIFIHQVLSERKNNGKKILWIELSTILLASMFGILDECIQAIIPSRIFDIQDIIFNVFAVNMAVFASWILNWVRRRSIKNQQN